MMTYVWGHFPSLDCKQVFASCLRHTQSHSFLKSFLSFFSTLQEKGISKFTQWFTKFRKSFRKRGKSFIWLLRKSGQKCFIQFSKLYCPFRDHHWKEGLWHVKIQCYFDVRNVRFLYLCQNSETLPCFPAAIDIKNAKQRLRFFGCTFQCSDMGV